jgi:hypothetical protein
MSQTMQIAPDTVPAEAISDQRMWIPTHVYVCVTSDGSVILDLKRNRYYGLGREDTELLATTVPGWPPAPWQTVSDATAFQKTERARLCQSLLKDGLLTRNEPDPSAAARVVRIDMKAEFVSVGDELEVRGRVTLRHVATFAIAYVSARYSLGWGSFMTAVAAVRERKLHGANDGDSRDVLQLAALVDVFRRLRCHVFAAEGRCLLHALTLVKFLNRCDFYPDWVIGVTTQPWSAHSWVQWRSFLLDTNPEKVCHYTPIMIV